MNYLKLKLPKKIDGAETVGDLAARGCSICGGKLYAEASSGFGGLCCSRHGRIWSWIPSFKERDGYAPTAWRNLKTGEIVQFERFGFVRIENIDNKITGFFAHK